MSDRIVEAACTWRPEAECAGCAAKGALNCRWNAGDLGFFPLNTAPSLVLATVGLYLLGAITGAWWPLYVYTAIGVAFAILGTRMLCSHCPYYSEKSRVLHCLLAHGMLKLWRYRPGPMRSWEKAGVTVLTAALVLVPLLAEIALVLLLGRMQFGVARLALVAAVGLTVATALAFAQLALVAARNFCRRCVHFSCPFNRVPGAVVDEYLRRNPAMREAWAKVGHEVR